MEIEEFMFKLATGFQGHKKGIYVTGERLKTKVKFVTILNEFFFIYIWRYRKNPYICDILE